MKQKNYEITGHFDGELPPVEFVLTQILETQTPAGLDVMSFQEELQENPHLEIFFREAAKYEGLQEQKRALMMLWAITFVLLGLLALRAQGIPVLAPFVLLPALLIHTCLDNKDGLLLKNAMREQEIQVVAAVRNLGVENISKLTPTLQRSYRSYLAIYLYYQRKYERLLARAEAQKVKEAVDPIDLQREAQIEDARQRLSFEAKIDSAEMPLEGLFDDDYTEFAKER